MDNLSSTPLPAQHTNTNFPSLLSRKPKKFLYEFRAKFCHVPCSDRRGKNAIFHSSRSRFFLFDLTPTHESTNHSLFHIHTNDHHVDTSSFFFKSSAKIPNSKYNISLFLTQFFKLDTRIPWSIKKKYFSRLRSLLLIQKAAIENRLHSNSSNNRQTRSYIKFSHKKTRYYLGFYMACEDSTPVVIDSVLNLHSQAPNFCCTIPAPFVMSQGRKKCPYHVKPSYIHHVNHNFIPFEKGQDHVRRKISNQANNQKRVFSNRLGISYTVNYTANCSPVCPGQKKFFEYNKQYSAFSHYTTKSPQQQKRWIRFLCKHGAQKRKRIITLHPTKISNRISQLYTRISPASPNKGKGRIRDSHNHYHFEDFVLHPSKRAKMSYDLIAKRKIDSMTTPPNKRHKCEFCRKLFSTVNYKDHVYACKDNPYTDYSQSHASNSRHAASF